MFHSGPNRGWTYVTGTSYHISDASYINRAYVSGATPTAGLTPTDAAVCAAANGPSTPNWYQYNTECRGIPDLVIVDLYGKIWEHEQLHFTRQTEAASQDAYDAHKAVENLYVFGSTNTLHQLLASVFSSVNGGIAANSSEANVNVGASFYVWNRGGVSTFTYDHWTF